jgi:hypothetical protein
MCYMNGGFSKHDLLELNFWRISAKRKDVPKVMAFFEIFCSEGAEVHIHPPSELFSRRPHMSVFTWYFVWFKHYFTPIRFWNRNGEGEKSGRHREC